MDPKGLVYLCSIPWLLFAILVDKVVPIVGEHVVGCVTIGLVGYVMVVLGNYVEWMAT